MNDAPASLSRSTPVDTESTPPEAAAELATPAVDEPSTSEDELEDEATTVQPRSLPRPGRLDAGPAAHSFADAQARARQERVAHAGLEDSAPRVPTTLTASSPRTADALLQSAFADLVQSDASPGATATTFDENADEFRPHRQWPRWMWPASGAAAIVTALVLFVGSSDDAERADDALKSSSMLAAAETEPSTASTRSPAARPALPPPTAEPATEVALVDDALALEPVGEPVDEQADQVDAALEEQAAEQLEADEDENSNAQTVAASDATAGSKPSHSRRSTKARRSKKSRDRSKSTPAPTAPKVAPQPAKSKAKPATASELLASAKKALAAGQARKAYSLAKRSRDAKRTDAALLVMGRAACRMKDVGKAKAAISELSFRNARTVRKECRERGVRAGL